MDRAKGVLDLASTGIDDEAYGAERNEGNQGGMMGMFCQSTWLH